jgi:cold shock CspA family protein
MTKQTGELKNWFSSRGFGFITMPNGEDVFLQASQVPKAAIFGFENKEKCCTLKFDMGTGKNGRPMAVNVEVMQ